MKTIKAQTSLKKAKPMKAFNKTKAIKRFPALKKFPDGGTNPPSITDTFNPRTNLLSIVESQGYKDKLKAEVEKSKVINPEYTGTYEDLYNERLSRVQNTPILNRDLVKEQALGYVEPRLDKTTGINSPVAFLDEDHATSYAKYNPGLDNTPKYIALEELEHASHIPVDSKGATAVPYHYFDKEEGTSKNLTPYALDLITKMKVPLPNPEREDGSDNRQAMLKANYLGIPTEMMARKRRLQQMLIEEGLLQPGGDIDDSHFDYLKKVNPDAFQELMHVISPSRRLDPTNEAKVRENIKQLFNTTAMNNQNRDAFRQVAQDGLKYNPYGFREDYSTPVMLTPPAQSVPVMPEYKQQYNSQDAIGNVNKDFVPAPKTKYLGEKKAQKWNNDLSWNVLELVEPTGVASYPDVYDAWNDGKFTSDDIIEPLGAIPAAGYFGKVVKGYKHAAGSLPKILNAFNTATDANDIYQQNIKRNGGVYNRNNSTFNPRRKSIFSNGGIHTAQSEYEYRTGLKDNRKNAMFFPGSNQMTMKGMSTPIKYYGLTDGIVTDSGYAYPGQDFKVRGRDTLEFRIK